MKNLTPIDIFGAAFIIVLLFTFSVIFFAERRDKAVEAPPVRQGFADNRMLEFCLGKGYKFAVWSDGEKDGTKIFLGCSHERDGSPVFIISQ